MVEQERKSIKRDDIIKGESLPITQTPCRRNTAVKKMTEKERNTSGTPQAVVMSGSLRGKRSRVYFVATVAQLIM